MDRYAYSHFDLNRDSHFNRNTDYYRNHVSDLNAYNYAYASTFPLYSEDRCG